MVSVLDKPMFLNAVLFCGQPSSAISTIYSFTNSLPENFIVLSYLCHMLLIKLLSIGFLHFVLGRKKHFVVFSDLKPTLAFCVVGIQR
jgi:hypothetical protein